jgi:hypothetical protein
VSRLPARCFNLSTRRAASTSDAPAAENASAHARPMPLDAPVITTQDPRSVRLMTEIPS